MPEPRCLGPWNRHTVSRSRRKGCSSYACPLLSGIVFDKIVGPYRTCDRWQAVLMHVIRAGCSA